METEKITQKWLQFAKGDLEAAEVLLKFGKTNWSYQLCVLHCHQAIEKILKTVIVAKGKEPRRTHDLIILLEKTQLKLPKEFQEYIDELNPHYQIPRYPDVRYRGPVLRYNKAMAHEHFKKTKTLFLWLTKKIMSEK